jgi:hypothetical protein
MHHMHTECIYGPLCMICDAEARLHGSVSSHDARGKRCNASMRGSRSRTNAARYNAD